MQKAKFLLAWAVCLALFLPVLAQTKKPATSPPAAKTAKTA